MPQFLGLSKSSCAVVPTGGVGMGLQLSCKTSDESTLTWISVVLNKCHGPRCPTVSENILCLFMVPGLASFLMLHHLGAPVVCLPHAGQQGQIFCSEPHPNSMLTWRPHLWPKWPSTLDAQTASNNLTHTFEHFLGQSLGPGLRRQWMT